MGGSGLVRWLGHSSVIIDMDGVRLLTDPVLGVRVGPLRRVVELAAPPGPADAVLISHAHHDHLDLPTLRGLPGRPLGLVAPGCAALVGAATGGPVRELAPGEAAWVGPLRVRAVPAEHSGDRFGRRVESTPIGFVIEGSRRVYFAGDTDLFEGMGELGPLDLALVPVWGWGPSVGAGHLDPARAAEAVRRCVRAVPSPSTGGRWRFPCDAGRRPRRYAGRLRRSRRWSSAGAPRWRCGCHASARRSRWRKAPTTTP